MAHKGDGNQPLQAELEALRRKYKALLAATSDAVITVDLATGRILGVNPQAVKDLERSEADLMRLHAWDLVAPEEQDRIAALLQQTRDRGAFSTEVEFRFLAPDGSLVPSVAKVNVVVPGPEPVALAFVRDVTEERQIERRLAETEEQYRALVAALPDPVFVHNERGEYVAANAAAAAALGMAPEELVGKRLEEIWPGDVADRRLALVRQVFATGRSAMGDENEVQTPLGPRSFSTKLAPVKDGSGRVRYVIGIARDITDRKRAEDALRESEQRYRTVVEDQTELICRFLPDFTLTFVNEAYCRYFGKTRDQLLGHRFLPLIPEEDRAKIRDHFAGFSPERPIATHEHRVITRGGDLRWQQWTNRAFFDREGALVEFQAVGRDVTERRQLEERLREAQKMEAVGQLAGGIAHDFNNLMTGILCQAGLLKTEAACGGRVHDAADAIERAARRAADLTGQLLGFARKGKHQNVAVDLDAVIDAVIKLVRTPDDRVRIVHRASPGPAAIMGDPGQLEQVVMNLALNARDAMPEGGTMAFGVAAAQVGPDHLGGRPDARVGPHFVLSVSDTGCGMSEEVRVRVFEPFFTTKEHGKGIGMGLAMVYGIVRNHGGWVEVESELGKGSTFRVFLPSAPEGVLAGAPEPGDKAARASGRILVVDDEEVVRRACARMLADLGYEVVTASNGCEAVACYEKSDAGFDLVIIDMRMPKMDGRECFRRLQEIDPGVRAILSTGFEVDGAAQEILDQGMLGFVSKPYEAGILTKAVAKALAAGPPLGH